jgi:hypothetical protein
MARRKLFWTELKEDINLITVSILIIFLLLTQLSLHIAINSYKKELSTQEEFIQGEKQRVSQYINYTQYGYQGFRVLLAPDPLSAISGRANNYPSLISFIDTGAGIKLYSPQVGADIFTRTATKVDLSSICILLGSLLACAFGLYTHQVEYSKFLYSVYKKNVIIILHAAKLLLLFAFVLIIGASTAIMYALHGIPLSMQQYWHILCFFLAFYLLLSVFYMMGFLIGRFKVKIILAVLLWFTFNFVITGWITEIVISKAEKIVSKYTIELSQLKILSKFEKKALDYAQRYTNIPEMKKKNVELVEDYYNTEFTQIEDMDRQMFTEIETVILSYEKLCSLTPITLMSTLSNEISSRGFKAYKELYRYNLELRRKFLRYYLNKKFHENYKEVIPFLKDEKYLYTSNASLPQYFLRGILINLFVFVIFAVLSIWSFLKNIYRLSASAEMPEGKINLNMKEGVSAFLTGTPAIKQHLFNYFSGKQELIGSCSIPVDGDFIFIPDLKKLPLFIRQKILIHLCSTFDFKEKRINAQIIENAVKYPGIIVIDEYNGEMPKVKNPTLVFTVNYYQAQGISKNIIYLESDESVPIINHYRKKTRD